MNLLSVTHLTKVGARVQFVKGKCEISNSDNELIGTTFFSDGLFRLLCTIIGIEHTYITKYHNNAKAVHVACSTTTSASINVWHAHLRHISVDSILKMVWSGMVKGMDVIGSKKDVSVYCEECERSGHTQSPIPKEMLTQSQHVLRCIFSDVCEVQTTT